MLFAGKGEILVDVFLMAARIVRMLANGGATAGTIVAVLAVVAVGFLLYFAGQQSDA